MVYNWLVEGKKTLERDVGHDWCMDVQPINMHHGKTELVVVEVVEKVVQGKPSEILV